MVSLAARQLSKLVTEYTVCFSTQFRWCSGVFLAGTGTRATSRAGGRAGAHSILLKGTVRGHGLAPVGVSGGVWGRRPGGALSLHRCSLEAPRGDEQCRLGASAFHGAPSPVSLSLLGLPCPAKPPGAHLQAAAPLLPRVLAVPRGSLCPHSAELVMLRSSFQALGHTNCHQSS